MTSRELTSGFKFWSRGHIRMVAMHLPIKFGADLVQSYWHFSEVKDGGRRHLGLVGGSHGTTHEGTLVVRTSCKNFVIIG